MEWIIGFTILGFIGNFIGSDKNKEVNKSTNEPAKDIFPDLEKMLKGNRIKALKKELELIDQRIKIEKNLITKMQEISKKQDKNPVEYIGEAKIKTDILSMKILKAKGRKKMDLEFKRSQELENQKYWIRQILL
jgi:hypothetical protein